MYTSRGAVRRNPPDSEDEESMHSSSRETYFAASAVLIGAIVLASCAGPQPLSRAIDQKDDDAYAAALKDGKVSPRDAFLGERARTASISLEEAVKRDNAMSATRNPFDARHDQASVSRGAVIFKHECAACHGDNVDGNGPALPAPMPSMSFHRNALRWDITMRGGAVAKWFKTIREGTTARATKPDGTEAIVQMPAFDQRLSREQTWLVITYLQSFDRDLPAEGTSR